MNKGMKRLNPGLSSAETTADPGGIDDSKVRKQHQVLSRVLGPGESR